MVEFLYSAEPDFMFSDSTHETLYWFSQVRFIISMSWSSWIPFVLSHMEYLRLCLTLSFDNVRVSYVPYADSNSWIKCNASSDPMSGSMSKNLNSLAFSFMSRSLSLLARLFCATSHRRIKAWA